MKVCVIAQDATFSNAFGVAEALNEYADVMAVFRQKTWKKFEINTVNYAYGYENIPRDYDKYVVCGAGTYLDVESYIEDQKKMLLILSDSHYVWNKDYINEKTKNSVVLVMNDLVVHRSNLPFRVFYHPMRIPDISSSKHKCISASHSPATKKKEDQKGTKYIRAAALKTRVPLRTIKGKTWEKTLRIKNKHKIFIDQVGDMREGFSGALGKSGLEGMLLGCLTMTNFTPIVGDIPNPPVVNVDRYNIQEMLLHYKNNPVELAELSALQEEWARKYTSYKFFANRIARLWEEGS